MTTLTQNERKRNKTVVRYDRSRQCWQAINGQVYEFDAGEDGKRAALLKALSLDHPELHGLVTALLADNPDTDGLPDRAIRAAQLVTKGHVSDLEIKHEGEYIRATVQSQSSEKEYKVHFNLGAHCECQDWEDGRAVWMDYTDRGGAPSLPDFGLACKHTLAVWLASQLQQRREEFQQAAERVQVEQAERWLKRREYKGFYSATEQEIEHAQHGAEQRHQEYLERRRRRLAAYDAAMRAEPHNRRGAGPAMPVRQAWRYR